MWLGGMCFYFWWDTVWLSWKNVVQLVILRVEWKLVISSPDTYVMRLILIKRVPHSGITEIEGGWKKVTERMWIFRCSPVEIVSVFVSLHTFAGGKKILERIMLIYQKKTSDNTSGRSLCVWENISGGSVSPWKIINTQKLSVFSIAET